MKLIPFVLLLAAQVAATAQTDSAAFAAEIARHRQHYREEFLTEPRSPLTASDTAFLDFYAADAAWRVEAYFEPTPDAETFDMPTYSGRTAQYRQFGTLTFEKNGTEYTLAMYQNIRLLQVPEYKDYLFIPFKDKTNGETTYGGGRYFELRFADIVEHEGRAVVFLDFNKCFNPYCAYKDGYNCPVPPKENHLSLPVPAGERLFKGEKKH